MSQYQHMFPAGYMENYDNQLEMDMQEQQRAYNEKGSENFNISAGFAIGSAIVTGSIAVILAYAANECIDNADTEDEGVRNSLILQLLVAGVCIGFLLAVITKQGVMSITGKYAMSISVIIIAVNAMVSYFSLRDANPEASEKLLTHEIINTIGMGVGIGVLTNALFLSVGYYSNYQYDTLTAVVWPSLVILCVITIFHIASTSNCDKNPANKSSSNVKIVAWVAMGLAVLTLVVSGAYKYAAHYKEVEKYD